MNEIHQTAKQLYSQLHPEQGELGKLGPPGDIDKGKPYWDTAMGDENLQLVESIYALQLCLNTLRKRWEQRNQNLPTDTITADIVSPIGMTTQKIDVKLIPHNALPDWRPHSREVGVGFRVESIDGRYEIDDYPDSPTAYPK